MYTLDTEQVAGGSAARVRVIATDGFNTAEETSPTLSVAGKSANAAILLPEDGSEYVVGEQIQLVGDAYDLEEGTVAGSQLLWQSDVDGTLGSGSELLIDNLSAGTHRVTLSVTGDSAESARMTIEIRIQDANRDIYLPFVIR